MTCDHDRCVPKVHPPRARCCRKIRMDLHGFEVPGDPELMLRLLVEEYARMGWGRTAILHWPAIRSTRRSTACGDVSARRDSRGGSTRDPVARAASSASRHVRAARRRSELVQIELCQHVT